MFFLLIAEILVGLGVYAVAHLMKDLSEKSTQLQSIYSKKSSSLCSCLTLST